MTASLYALCVGLLVWAAWKSGLLATVKTLLATFAATARELGDKSLTDSDRERLARRRGIEAAGMLGLLCMKLALVAAAGIGPALILDRAGYVPMGEVLAFSLRPSVIVGTCAVFMAIPPLARRMAGNGTVTK